MLAHRSTLLRWRSFTVVPVKPTTAYAPVHPGTYALEERVSQRPKYLMFESIGEPSPVAAEAGCTAVATTATSATATTLMLNRMTYLVFSGRVLAGADWPMTS